MAQFSIQDGIIPELFAQEVMNQSTKTNRLVQCGVLTPDPVLSGKLTQSGQDFIKVGFNNDLYGEPQIWGEHTDIQVNNFNSGYERTYRMQQAVSFGYTDLAQLKTSSDPAGEIASRLSNFWQRQDEQLVLKMLTGIFNTDIMKTYRSFGSNGTKFSARGFLAALNLFGDLQDNTKVKLLVNSAVYSEMKAQQLIDTVQPNGAITPFGTYNGCEIVVDDDIPIDDKGNADTYLLANNSIAYGVAAPTDTPAFETEREAKPSGGRTNIINRRILTTHLLGTTVSDSFTPSNPDGVTADDLQNPAMWDVKRDIRNIQAIKYTAQVSDDFIPKQPKKNAIPATPTSPSTPSIK